MNQCLVVNIIRLLIKYFSMTEIRIDTIQKNYEAILKMVGTQSFVNWDKFSKSSSDVINCIDHLNKRINTFRQGQHRIFIQAMKKLKNLDLPDLINAVKGKKLPKQALRGVLNKFRMNKNDTIELVESTQTLKQNAHKQMNEYISKNDGFIAQLKKFEGYLDKRIEESGFNMEIPNDQTKFNLSDELATTIASKIKIEPMPDSDYIGLKTYSQIVEGTFDLIRDQNQKLTRAARIQQRANRKDKAKYLSILQEYLLNGQSLIVEGQKTIAKKIGLPQKKLQQSEIMMLEKGLSSHLMIIQSQLRARVKQSIPPTKQIPLNKAKIVIQYQIQMLNQKQEYLKQVLEGVEKSPQKLQVIPLLLALVLNDMVYDKFGCEEEDFMKYVNEEVILKSVEFQNLFREMEVAIIKLMKFIGLISPEDTLSQALSMYQSPKSSAVAPGMMPGSNPMEMLQMQQMQQMQQMFQAQSKAKK